MPRLFAAVELPRLAAERLALIRSELTGARWMAAENMHITLRFAGDVTDAEAREFAAALDAVDGAPFPLKIQGVGHFGGRETTAVWAGVAASAELDTLQRAIDLAPFVPAAHGTFASLRPFPTYNVKRAISCGVPLSHSHS